MRKTLEIPATKDGRPVALVAKTTVREDGTLMLGRWTKDRRGAIEVRLDLAGAVGVAFDAAQVPSGRVPVVAFALEMN